MDDAKVLLPLTVQTNVKYEAPEIVDGSRTRPVPQPLTLTITVTGLLAGPLP